MAVFRYSHIRVFIKGNTFPPILGKCVTGSAFVYRSTLKVFLSIFACSFGRFLGTSLISKACIKRNTANFFNPCISCIWVSSMTGAGSLSCAIKDKLDRKINIKISCFSCYFYSICKSRSCSVSPA